MANPALAPIDVFLGEGMAVNARRLRVLGERWSTALHIFPMRDWLNMSRIDARAVAAEVVKFKARRDGANEQFIGKTMSIDARMSAVPVNRHFSVAIRVQATRPNPTHIGRAPGKCQSLNRAERENNERIAMSTPAFPMLWAPTPSHRRPRAPLNAASTLSHVGPPIQVQPVPGRLHAPGTPYFTCLEAL